MAPARIIEAPSPIRRIGSGDFHHFFGYYNKSCWDRDDRRVLCNRVAMMTADLGLDDIAEVGYYDLDSDRPDVFHKLGETSAWNWQMGCQSQWLDGLLGRQVIYNVRRSSHGHPYPDFGADIVDADSGERRELPLPVYVTAPNSHYALCVDYRRLFVTHETIGYQAQEQYRSLEPAPADDGIYHLDLVSGAYELVCSYRRLRDFHPVASMDKALHWVSHIEIAPGSARALFLHRWTERVEDETCFLHRLISMNPDGSDMLLLECSDHPLPQLQADFDAKAVSTFDYEKSEYQISHPTWRDDEHIMVWGPHKGSIHYHLYTDRSQHAEIVGADTLTENGHMTYAPGGRWMLSDTYPDDVTHERTLFLYDTASQRRLDVGRFYADPALGKINRCDLHPRWNRAGTQACIDSVHEHERQMYVLDLGAMVAGSAAKT
ncbi:MAG: hypothetical protein AAGI11_01930 [Pseudomonadota bacterium]